MKLRNLFIGIVLLLGLVHFSPEFVNAESNDAELQQEVIDDPTPEVEEQDKEEPEVSVDEDDETNEQVKDESDDSINVDPENEQQANEESTSNEAVEKDEQDATEKLEPQNTETTETEEPNDEKPADKPAEKTSEVQIQTFSVKQVLESGIYDDRVIELKKNLNQLGFTSFKNPNNYYASKTKQGVEDFQSYYGLPVTGVADEGTLAKIAEVLDTPFQKGKRHEDSVEIKEQLTTLGYASFSNPTTYYGVQTEKAVKAFQRDYGLPESGIVDTKTRTLLEEQANVPLQSGMYRDDVITLKENLNQLGFTSFKNPNNYYASKTKQGVEDFQSYYGLPVTGVADEGTLSKIAEVLDTPFQKGKRHEDSVEIKEQLTILGYASFTNPTTYYGVQSENAVKAFQRANGLPESGIVDGKTRELLHEKATTPLQSGMYRKDAITLKENLNKLGFTSFKNPNDYFASKTEQGVKELQKYYGLPITGIADEATLSKISEVLASPFRRGKRHAESVDIKKQLVVLGFADFKNPNNLYGKQTEEAVKAFQKENGLPESGIADKKTRALIQEQESKVMSSGMRRDDVKTLKENLNKLGFTSFKNPNNYFASQTEQGVKDFQSYYGLPVTGKGDVATLNKIDELLASPYQKGKRNSGSKKIKEQLVRIGYADFKNPNNYYGVQTERAVKAFQKDHGLLASGIVDDATLDKLKNSSFVKIYIDPGHGAHDPGGTGYGLNEKDVVLDIGLAAAQELRKYQGVEVKLSRSNDTFIPLRERTNEANSWGANYFVSLHTNALNGSADGFESFIFNGSVSQETRDRQRDIHVHLSNWLSSNSGIDDRGMKRANFHVLRETYMPAILLEYMFIDNKRENNLLSSKSYRAQLGKVTAEAIAKSYNLKK